MIRVRRVCTLALAAALFGLVTPSLGHADLTAAEDVEQTRLVQNRTYRLEHEIGAAIGILPTDAFTKAMSVTGAYTYHLSDLWGVGGDFSYLIPFESSLRRELEQAFGVPSSQFTEMNYFGRLGGLFKPFYGKFSLLNDGQLHGEFFFSLYGVLARMQGGYATVEQPEGKGSRFGGGVAPGFGFRGFINRHFSLRFDLSWMVLASAGEVSFPLFLSLTAAATTRSDR